MAKNILKLKSFFSECFIQDDILYTQYIYTQSNNKNTITWRAALICSADINITDIGNVKKEKICFESNHYGIYFTEHKLRDDGKLIISSPTIISAGKNLNKINATTPFQQALSEIMSKFEKKIRDGGVTKKSDILSEINYSSIISRPIKNPNRVLPMAAHDKKKHQNKIVYPCFLQPKLDGVHLTATCYNGIDLYSRGLSKNISQNHIREALQPLCDMPTYYVVGELWDPKLNRQEITSIASQELDHNITQRLSLYVFDIFTVNTKQPYSERYEILKKFVETVNSEYIILVETIIVKGPAELEDYYETQLKLGMEGIMIKNPAAYYEFGVQKKIRSFGVLKYKPRPDAEFLIVGFKSGIGKFKGHIIFIAKTKEGKTFTCSPAWSDEAKREAYKKGKTFIGRKATIYYDTISSDGIPLQPVLSAFVN